MKIVIIGGVAGGASAAARLRRLSETANITLIERGEYVSFANCGLPYHIGGVIEDRDDLLVQTKAGLSQRFNLDVRTKTEARTIDRDGKTVLVRDLASGQDITLAYDKLILSPGAAPVLPPIPGLQKSGAMALRDMHDMDRIITCIKEHKPKRAVIIGGGFIGIEMAENLRHLNIEQISIVERLEQIMPPMDVEMAALAQDILRKNGIELYLKNAVQSVSSRDQRSALIHLANGQTLDADLIITSIGVRPEVTLARQAELTIGETGGIAVSPTLQTSDPDIYAVGDAVEVTHFVSGQKTLIPLAWPANRQGRLAADHILGKDPSPYAGSLGTAIVQVFDKTLACTGLSEKQCAKLGLPCHAVTVTRPNHVAYYPGSVPMKLKLVFSNNGKILGAQAFGGPGVDKRIDVIATAIKSKLKAQELQDLELCYAPPYGAAKDPINILGYAADNVLRGDLKVSKWHQLKEIEPQNTVLLDVRTQEEFARGSIPGSTNIPVDELRDQLDQLDNDKRYIVFCQVGQRAYYACRILQHHGFKKVSSLDGGYSLCEPVIRNQQP